MSDFIKDPMFFYAIAFVIFCGLVFVFGRTAILNWIDGEIAKVRQQLDEAQALRAEAEATLAEYKAKQAMAESEAQALLRNAQDEAQRLKAQAATDLQNSLQRQEQQVLERIRLAEVAALADVRRKGIELAVELARKACEAQVKGDEAAKLVDQAIAEIPVPSSKAKAA